MLVTYLSVRMVRRRPVVIVSHERRELFIHVIDDTASQHTGSRHITVGHYHVANVRDVHTTCRSI